MNIQVTITASPELLLVLQTIAGSLKPQASTPGKTEAPDSASSTEGSENGEVKKEGKKNRTTKTSDVKVDDTEESTSKVVQMTDLTIEQVRAKVLTASNAGKREQVKSLLAEFNTDSVTNLPKEKYPEFVQKLEAI